VTTGFREFPAEWDAGTYHLVSTPMVRLGQKVLQRLPLVGSETVADVGCGSGRLTEVLLERLPHGHVVAVDRSANMLAEAEAYLKPRFGDQVSFLQADAQHLELPVPVDAIFSTATFHWIPDHPTLFRRLFASLKPGGRLVAQCGGGPNIARLRQRVEALRVSPEYRDKAIGWSNPWEFATPEETEVSLAQAGFIDIEAGLEATPITFPDAAEYREFVRSVVLRAHLDIFPDNATRDAFIDEITALAADDEPPYTLDYWRLNLAATRPIAS
jgi:trans-aconitate 2-methyltransferase